jgi:hypothetical protein
MELSACAATVKLAANERKMIAVRALGGTEPVSTLAARHGVSRPLVYRQMHKASAALDELFSPAQTDDVDKCCSGCRSPDAGWSRPRSG